MITFDFTLSDSNDGIEQGNILRNYSQYSNYASSQRNVNHKGERVIAVITYLCSFGGTKLLQH
jgi:hypothetical protein